MNTIAGDSRPGLGSPWIQTPKAWDGTGPAGGRNEGPAMGTESWGQPGIIAVMRLQARGGGCRGFRRSRRRVTLTPHTEARHAFSCRCIITPGVGVQSTAFEVLEGSPAWICQHKSNSILSSVLLLW